MKLAQTFAGIAVAAALVACGPLGKAENVVNTFMVNPQNAALMDWMKGFKPQVEAALVAVEQHLPTTEQDIKMLCGGSNTMDTLFNAAVLFVQIPSGGVELEHLAFKGVQGICAIAQNGTLPSGHELAAMVTFWSQTKDMLANSGFKL